MLVRANLITRISVFRKLHTTALNNSVFSKEETGKSENVVLIDAVRTPFLLSNGTYRDLMAVDLQRHALRCKFFLTKYLRKQIFTIIVLCFLYLL